MEADGTEERTTRAPAAADPHSTLAPFREPLYRAVWFANMLSGFGATIQAVGASWMMTAISGSAVMVALVQSTVTLPIMLLSLIAGALADNLDRRTMMLAAQVFMLAMSTALTVCAWQGLITPWLLLSFTFAIGCGTALNAPAWQASVGDMVPRAQLPAAVALNSIGFNIARSVGPAVGGLIVAGAGFPAAFAVNAMSYTALIAVLVRWRPAPRDNPLPPETLGPALAAGIRYASASPAIRTVLLRGLVFGVGTAAVTALTPLVAKHLIGGGPRMFGVLLGAFGLGAVAGALSSSNLRRRFSIEAIVSCCGVSLAAGALVMGRSTVAWLTIAALSWSGAAWILTLATFNATVQMSAPRWVVGRALSLYQVFTFGGMALGSWLWGTVAASQGLTTAFVFGAGVTLISVLLGRAWPLSQLGELNLDPLRQWHEPVTTVPIERRAGPVAITIEYIIDEQDVLEFLRAMAERRRVRRRDGARQWTLHRDLGDPRVWIERYQTPTWLDYVRHNNRQTQEDAIVSERLRALHRGTNPPAVRRTVERQTTAPGSETPAAQDLT